MKHPYTYNHNRCWALSIHSFLLIGITVLSNTSTTRVVFGADQDYTLDDEQQCGLYLASSSTGTPQKPAWGIYAGKDLPANVNIGSPELAIHILDMRSHISWDEAEDDEQYASLERMVDYYHRFFWAPESVGAMFEHPDPTVGTSFAALSGAGSLAATNSDLTNSRWSLKSAYCRTSLNEESGVSHPGRGAMSHLHSQILNSTNDIKKGMELFVYVGEEAAVNAEHDGKKQLSPDDFTKVDELVEKLTKYFDKHKDIIDKEARQQMYDFLLRDVLVEAVGTSKAFQIAKMLPAKPDELKKFIAEGGSISFVLDSGYKTISWLKENGLCMDNIRSGKSTIPNGGLGAFATRAITKDGLVAPVPLMHIPYKSVFDMYELIENEDGEYVHRSDNIIGKQLLFNYVYGHPESNMVFYPTGAIVTLINHSDNPNAKLVWSKHPQHNQKWMDLEPAVLAEEKYEYIGLMMEIIATRDIEPNEEIFIDYGLEWKKAWDDHVAAWNSKINNGEIPTVWPMRAADMNSKYKSIPFEVGSKEDVYPKNVELRAFLQIKEDSGSGTQQDPYIFNYGGEDEGIDGEDAYHPENLVHVTIHKSERREDGDGNAQYFYTVFWAKGSKSLYIKDVPHSVFTFIDKPGTSDQFLEGTFRHYIGIPDEIFPEAWRNLSTED